MVVVSSNAPSIFCILAWVSTSSSSFSKNFSFDCMRQARIYKSPLITTLKITFVETPRCALRIATTLSNLSSPSVDMLHLNKGFQCPTLGVILYTLFIISANQYRNNMITFYIQTTVFILLFQPYTDHVISWFTWCQLNSRWFTIIIQFFKQTSKPGIIHNIYIYIYNNSIIYNNNSIHIIIIA